MATYSRPGVFIQEVELPQAIELAEGGAAIGAASLEELTAFNSSINCFTRNSAILGFII